MPSRLRVHKYTCAGIYPEDRLITDLIDGCILPMASTISWAGVNSNPAELCNTFLSANRLGGKSVVPEHAQTLSYILEAAPVIPEPHRHQSHHFRSPVHALSGRASG